MDDIGVVKPDPNCPKCKGKGEYYLCLPDDVGSPNLVKCDCVEPKFDNVLEADAHNWDTREL